MMRNERDDNMTLRLLLLIPNVGLLMMVLGMSPITVWWF